MPVSLDQLLEAANPRSLKRAAVTGAHAVRLAALEISPGRADASASQQAPVPRFLDALEIGQKVELSAEVASHPSLREQSNQVLGYRLTILDKADTLEGDSRRFEVAQVGQDFVRLKRGKRDQSVAVSAISTIQHSRGE